jgi:muramoyltetrapeptide carboxypeptidase
MAQKPTGLRKGNVIRAVAPASSESSSAALNKGLDKLQRFGFKITVGSCVGRLRTRGYLAATDEERADELNEAFRDHAVNAVFCVTGGYGTLRILPYLDYEMIRANPKIFLGFSDITALHVALNQKSGLVTFHGPMIASEMGSEFTDYTERWLLKALQENAPLGELTNPLDGPMLKTINDGEAKGKLIGGNLSLIAHGLGTPYEIETKDKILLIEDTDEPPYRVDRYLTQLWLANKLQDAAGIVIGEFTNYELTSNQPSLTLWEVLRDRLEGCGKPTLYGLCFGHGKHHLTLPIGVEARLDATQRRIWIEESATSS